MTFRGFLCRVPTQCLADTKQMHLSFHWTRRLSQLLCAFLMQRLSNKRFNAPSSNQEYCLHQLRLFDWRLTSLICKCLHMFCIPAATVQQKTPAGHRLTWIESVAPSPRTENDLTSMRLHSSALANISPITTSKSQSTLCCRLMHYCSLNICTRFIC